MSQHPIATNSRSNLRFMICTAQTDLWVEEDLGSQEALVAHVDGELLLANCVDASVLLDPLGAVRVVLLELFD